MIEKFEDLDFTKLNEYKKEDINIGLNEFLSEQLGSSLEAVLTAASNSISERAEELSLKCHGMSPNGDYSKYTDDPSEIVNILKTDGSNKEKLKIHSIKVHEEADLLKMNFYSDGVDDGKTLVVTVYLDVKGNIRHAFPQVI